MYLLGTGNLKKKKIGKKLIDIKFVFNGTVTLKSITKRGYTFQENPISLEIYKK